MRKRIAFQPEALDPQRLEFLKKIEDQIGRPLKTNEARTMLDLFYNRPSEDRSDYEKTRAFVWLIDQRVGQLDRAETFDTARKNAHFREMLVNSLDKLISKLTRLKDLIKGSAA